MGIINNLNASWMIHTIAMLEIFKDTELSLLSWKEQVVLSSNGGNPIYG